MKKVLALVVVSLVCSACGTRISEKIGKQQYTASLGSSYEQKYSGSPYGAGSAAAKNGGWSSTPDGFPVW